MQNSLWAVFVCWRQLQLRVRLVSPTTGSIVQLSECLQLYLLSPSCPRSCNSIALITYPACVIAVPKPTRFPSPGTGKANPSVETKSSLSTPAHTSISASTPAAAHISTRGPSTQTLPAPTRPGLRRIRKKAITTRTIRTARQLGPDLDLDLDLNLGLRARLRLDQDMSATVQHVACQAVEYHHVVLPATPRASIITPTRTSAATP